MSSAIMNRMLHVELKPTARDWLDWAYANGIHEWILSYVETRPDHLSLVPPKLVPYRSGPRPAAPGAARGGEGIASDGTADRPARPLLRSPAPIFRVLKEEYYGESLGTVHR